jgi:hypothetical protein
MENECQGSDGSIRDNDISSANRFFSSRTRSSSQHTGAKKIVKAAHAVFNINTTEERESKEKEGARAT